MAENIEQTVRTRRVFYIPGYDPIHPRRYRELYRKEGSAQAQISDYQIALSPKTGGGNYGWNVAAHLTCVNATREETLEIANSYKSVGVNEIVALRGDPPKGAGQFTPAPGGFANSVELIEALAATGNFKIRVGAYPDPHPDAADDRADIIWLKEKFKAGADSAITQFFFDADTFFRFRDRCAKEGITGKIIPGILPITSWTGVQKFAAACGTPLPAQYANAFETAEDQQAVSIELCTKLCETLIQGGVEDLHFYTLNRPTLTKAVCANLGVNA